MPSATSDECLTVPSGVAPIPVFVDFDLNRWRQEENPDQLVLEYLNLYGPKPIIKAHSKAAVQGKSWETFLYQDLTGDGLPELALVASLFYIFGCRAGLYQTLYTQTDIDGYLSPYWMTDLRDGNRNGIPEMLFITHWWTQGGHAYQVLEWNGSQFHNLLVPDRPEFPESGAIFVEASGEVHFKGLARGGTQEIAANSGIPIWEIYYDGLPWRNEATYYKWDGRNYRLYDSELASPVYRFQAVQDGDRLSVAGEYDEALEMYQQAIFSDKLEWWSPERRENFQAVFSAGFVKGQPTPTLPAPDSNEYYFLAAYARYRIMLLHLLRSRLSAAQIVYETLQEKFPVEKPGHASAEMAAAFWKEYQLSKDLRKACAEAIDYVRQHPDILVPIGSDYHGWQSQVYKPEDVCPFK